MAIRKFVAPTTREAMMQVRRELGDDAVIIANRRVGNRIEILAAAPDAVEALVERSEVRAEARTPMAREPGQPAERNASNAVSRPKAEPFQDFVRRQMQAESEAQPARAAARATPARAVAQPVARPVAGKQGLAMYQDVAEIEDDGEDLTPVERPAPRRVETSSARRPVEQDDAFVDDGSQRPARAATLPQSSHRAPQIETAPVADPAVFRRRPAHVAPAARAEAARATPQPAGLPPVDILLEPNPVHIEPAPLLPPSTRGGAEAAAPIAAGHAPVPSLPMRSQAAPIATAARLREASINAAQLARAAMHTNAAAPIQASQKPAADAVAQPAAAQADVVAPVAQAAVNAPAAANTPVVAAQAAAVVAPIAPAAAAAVAEVATAPLVAPVSIVTAAPVAAAPIVAATPIVATAPSVTAAPDSEAASAPHIAPVVQVAPIMPVALAIESPSLRAAVSAWEVQYTARTAPVVRHTVAAQSVAMQSVAMQSVAMQPTAAQPVAAQANAVLPTAVQPNAAQPTTAPVTAAQPAIVAQPVPEPAAPRMESALLAELQSMRDILREQIATLATKPVAAAAPMTAAPASTNGSAMRVMTRLLTAGFSADVARRIAANVPANADVAQAEEWLQDVLTHNIRCIEPADGIVERAGRPGTPGQTFALVGPTGVGKTTTVAKLAARFAVRHGTSALGLITLDAYRVAAPEQLRAYGRILGTPVHLAQDVATLRELLATMVHKRLVLIDTCGLSQRDERLGEMLDLLASAGTASRPIQRVLLMNSASHAETLDDAARAWRASECTGTILTKLDEATRIGGSLDASLRHRLTLLGLTNGQRVPEDWHAANSRLLAHLALKPAAQLFDLADDEGAALIDARGALPALHGRVDG